MEQTLLGLAIIGAITTLKLSGKVSGWITVTIAIALGAFAGYGGVEGLNVFTGVLTALAAIGTVTIADRLAGRTQVGVTEQVG